MGYNQGTLIRYLWLQQRERKMKENNNNREYNKIGLEIKQAEERKRKEQRKR